MSPQTLTRRPLVIYGAGGHGRVVADAAAAAGAKVLGYLDDQPERYIEEGIRLFDPAAPELEEAAIIVAIADNRTRRTIAERLGAQGRPLQSVAHPAASRSRLAEIGKGTFLGPQTAVSTGARVGEGVIISSGAIVEHHARLGAWSQVGPGAVLGEKVELGEAATIGLGARVLPGVRIGARADVAAGAVVARDVPDDATVADLSGPG
ncbi:MAG: NeuD/PglB/VioB family sugar acetyltransferase [Phycisphaeraceae bacterium]